MASTFPFTSPINNPLLSFAKNRQPASSHRDHRKIPFKIYSQSNNQESGPINSPSNNNNNIIDFQKLDRRNVLLGLGGGMYGAATTLGGNNQLALGATPEAANPNVKECHLTSTAGGGAEGLECCPPNFKNIVDFDIRNYPNQGLKVRRPAHLVVDDEIYMAKFKKAVKKMRELPRSDPRNFMQQANVHCAYCDGSYRQIGHDDFDLLVHGSWLFFPFHRAYLYFFERILGKLIDDPTFAMPYWNWDHQDGMQMPSIYTNPDSPLFDGLRDELHQPPTVVDLNYPGMDSNFPNEELIKYNLQVMNIQMVRQVKPELFMGGRLYAGTDPKDVENGTGAIENVPHNAIHDWVGDRNDQPYHRDMGRFFSAARDPIFYAHHSNVDRMWAIWNHKLGNSNFKDRAWLDSNYVFYDENRQAVRIRNRDVQDIEKLGYTYEQQELPWLNLTKSDDVSSAPKLPTSEPPPSVTFPKPLDSVVRIRVSRPNKSRSEVQKEVATEVLTVQFKLVKEDEYVKFDVFLNDGEDDDIAETGTKVGKNYAGSFTILPHKTRKGGHKMSMNQRIKLPISDILDELGAEDQDYVDVTLVPQAGLQSVVLKNVFVDYVNY